MIPIRDSEAVRRFSPVNTLLIVANVAIFAYGRWETRSSGADLVRFAMVPALVSQPHPLGLEASILATLVTSQFLHAGPLHLAGNMLYLLIFGPAVEARMGHRRFLGFYPIAGVAAGLATVAMAPSSPVAVVGASGAIAGVLGAYFSLFPRGRITTFIFIRTIRIPAIVYLLAWFAIQLYSGVASSAPGPMFGGVAWWAHVGGFLFGVAAGPILARPIAPARRRR
ncbi:MAG TPA: rhomboid family intramembrane serine protease [Candidatus Binataceae bacterium]|nr:rhomboid family intramembrane serine protease [Candidatus Binataceae bacterium]